MGRRKGLLERVLEGLPETMVYAGLGGAVGYLVAPYDSRVSGNRRNAAILGAAFGALGGLLESLRAKGSP